MVRGRRRGRRPCAGHPPEPRHFQNARRSQHPARCVGRHQRQQTPQNRGVLWLHIHQRSGCHQEWLVRLCRRGWQRLAPPPDFGDSSLAHSCEEGHEPEHWQRRYQPQGRHGLRDLERGCVGQGADRRHGGRTQLRGRQAPLAPRHGAHGGHPSRRWPFRQGSCGHSGRGCRHRRGPDEPLRLASRRCGWPRSAKGPSRGVCRGRPEGWIPPLQAGH
mmetsp:Transcript_61348/g.190147  ORF Transcript_61348/g.190147 Transcript_61348/m.190147 type:complete len:217 (+) Transcript_61348:636-1286(+)